MTRNPELIGISFRTESRVWGSDLIVLTAKYQIYHEQTPARITTVDAGPGDLAVAVERGWIRSGEAK